MRSLPLNLIGDLHLRTAIPARLEARLGLAVKSFPSHEFGPIRRIATQNVKATPQYVNKATSSSVTEIDY